MLSKSSSSTARLKNSKRHVKRVSVLLMTSSRLESKKFMMKPNLKSNESIVRKNSGRVNMNKSVKRLRSSKILLAARIVSLRSKTI